MKARLLSLVLFFALLSTAIPAWAGGIIIIGREPKQATIEATSQTQAGKDGQDSTMCASSVANFGGGPASTIVGAPKPRVGPVDPPVDPMADVTAIVIADDEFGDVGCGGAQAASGPAGALPMILAGLALLLRRRR